MKPFSLSNLANWYSSISCSVNAEPVFSKSFPVIKECTNTFIRVGTIDLSHEQLSRAYYVTILQIPIPVKLAESKI